MQNIKRIITEDGSHSLHLSDLNETYHSFHGAIQESVHVYIKNGFHFLLQQPGVKNPTILEVGFGTGLNTLLTLGEAHKAEIKISLIVLEPFPLTPELIKSLNYNTLLSSIYPTLNFLEYCDTIHSAPWNEAKKISDFVTINKKKVKLQDYDNHGDLYDLIYFDAFAPMKQPEMWQPEIFQKLFKMMKKNGIIVTYCAQGQFKRNLKAAGFEVEALQGPPGKMEMVRGWKK